MVKEGARAEARAARRAIPSAQRETKSARILDHAMRLPEVQRARVVGCYVSVGSEVDTRLLLRALLARGVVVAVPTTRGDELSFVRLDHPWTLAPGAHGIPEPREPRTPIPGEELAVVFVPGLRFGRDGSRLGNGGGHFDRFLAAHPRALRVALAFTEQVVPSVATESHDQGMDVVVTDEGPLRPARAAKP